ncbi:hypothetical protein JQC91_00035 [Jannaschia sp. Os4]|uniref:hypothetical protein n=1 Tax=Jannaschia sp. Os4 TaxID=2807617 RepID=UPI001939DA47|nr:hypothetical protein [Jannaschia sp. Os4]MBM2574677.1 hypothetical protein [Jannaschia sp. Os4]
MTLSPIRDDARFDWSALPDPPPFDVPAPDRAGAEGAPPPPVSPFDWSDVDLPPDLLPDMGPGSALAIAASIQAAGLADALGFDL